MTKEESALHLIDTALMQFKAPAVMCSFGKDSLVALHLSMRVKRLPVIFHREPFFPRKYAYANSVIEAWDLDVYDYPPSGTAIQEKDGEVEIVNYYTIGQATCALPTGVIHPKEGERFICGLKDLLLKPRGTFAYPWDMVIHGHKSSDVDPFHGAVPLAADIGINLGSASPVFPIRNWTDDDVWEYIERHDLPIHHDRYEKVMGKWMESPDKTLNPDYLPACTACMRRGGGPVRCPKFNCEVANVSAQLPWTEPQKMAYME